MTDILPQRDVVVTLSDDTGVTCCSWMISIPAYLTAEEALAGCAKHLLEIALDDGDIEPAGTACFALREVDLERDAEFYMQEAKAAGLPN
ncbi:hypothetical protein [Sphingomonas sp. 3-13AW]|uniref:hypothetical protein n=1 Tax=Sphingomonas sp. 3-13AW TaxID=3050450 RepID=UPI003BB67FE2